ncbi:hypothetical protein GCM10023116_21870 [Kistimonas scapharcae]|uniref:Uncharacterized protein n=1 Tax=Kistimonas scapharcae TaxID=1036133 RepID=A0ABP8V297_9GAMM
MYRFLSTYIAAQQAFLLVNEAISKLQLLMSRHWDDLYNQLILLSTNIYRKHTERNSHIDKAYTEIINQASSYLRVESQLYHASSGVILVV